MAWFAATGAAGKFTDDPLETFGDAGVAEIPQLQGLLKYICREGFEHHVAANFTDVSKGVHEAAFRDVERARIHCR